MPSTVLFSLLLFFVEDMQLFCTIQISTRAIRTSNHIGGIKRAWNFSLATQTKHFRLRAMSSTTTTDNTMLAAVVHTPGGSDAYKLERLPIPTPKPGWVLVRIRAFGMNRSELFTRQGLSGTDVTFPRVLGIEAAGEVVSAPGGEFAAGDYVASCMGGMGRVFNGGYAEYTCVPAAQMQRLDAPLVKKLGWEAVGAAPEMLQTAYGALFKGLRLEKGQSLLVRGGTTSVGMAAVAIAKAHFGKDVTVVSTTRRADREAFLKEHGADEVVVDDGNVAAGLRKVLPRGADKVLELVGAGSLLDSLQCCAKFGSVCMVGMVGSKWTLDQFEPMGNIPSCVNLTVYGGDNADWMDTPINDLLAMMDDGRLSIKVGRVFGLKDIVEAATVQEKNTAGGKIVVLP